MAAMRGSFAFGYDCRRERILMALPMYRTLPHELRQVYTPGDSGAFLMSFVAVVGFIRSSVAGSLTVYNNNVMTHIGGVPWEHGWTG
jgi:hypothetical protein